MADERTIQVPFGIAGVDLGTVSRTVGADEPPPLAPNADARVVGKPTSRVDGRLKVTGAARYTADVRLPGMLVAKVLRSPYPHAHIRAIDTSAAERHPSVRAVHVLDHLRSGAVLRDPSREEASSHPVLRYVGQPIAAVAAITAQDAEEAVRLIRIDYEPLPFVVDVEAARMQEAPLVFPAAADQRGTAGGGGGPAGVPQTGNVHGPAVSGPLGPPRGDAVLALQTAEVVVQAIYRTQVQTHCALETHGVVADWRSDGLTVWSSTQGTSTVRDELAEVFDLPKSRVRVVTEFMGGGFGAKFGAGNYGVLATHLSKKAGAPVRLMLDRREEHVAAGNRPSSVQTLRIGAKKDGTLVAIHLDSYGTAGTGTGAGAGGPGKNMSPCPNALIEEGAVFTPAGPAAAFRAPGHPQGAFALEQSIDELAEKLGLDPVLLRDKIDFDDDEGGRNVDSAARKRERKLGAERFGWSRRRPAGSDPGPVKRGLGMAQAIWYRFVNLDSSCEVRITRDGSVEILSAVQDIGGGIRTALAQVVAEELGLQPGDVGVRIGDTVNPIGPPSGGSNTTGSLTPAARNAAWQAGRRLAEQIAPQLGVPADQVVFGGGKVGARGEGARTIPFRSAAAKLRTEEVTSRTSRSDDYGGFVNPRGHGGLGIGGLGGVQFAGVLVDTETGIVKVERVVAAHDCGRPINPLAVESQIHGGILQGLSYALYENRVLDRQTGIMVNANLDAYKIAGAREAPAIEVVLLEQYNGRSSTDAAGIGEPATVPTAAAIANAVYNATGVRMRELPMTPARVLAALAKAAGAP